MKRTTALGTAVVGMLAGGLSSCRGEDPEFDCSAQQQAFEASFADDGVLLDAVTDDATYPMAMVLSEAGLQRLLNGLVGADVPFASELNIGPYSINFVPKAAPVIEMAMVPNCSKCVLFSLGFNFELQDGDGEPAGAGVGDAQIAIPLDLRQNEDGSSSLVAIYERATVKDMPFNTMGFKSSDHPGLEGALEILATDALRVQYPTTELMHFEPWTIGGNDVKLSVRNFHIYRDTKVLALAMQTNLDLPESVAVDVGKMLPVEGVPMQLQMHPGLLLGMAQRMITEGEISRTYNNNGKPDPKGLYGVTLENMNADMIPGTNKLDVAFRVWRTDEGYCGYADAETALQLSIDPASNAIKVTPTDDLEVVGGAGVGELAEDNQELIDKNKQLVAEFQKSLSEQVGITINYNEVGVEGSRIIFDTDALIVERNNISILIDFKIAAAEDA